MSGRYRLRCLHLNSDELKMSKDKNMCHPKKKEKKKQFLMEYMCNDVRKIDFHFYVF